MYVYVYAFIFVGLHGCYFSLIFLYNCFNIPPKYLVEAFSPINENIDVPLNQLLIWATK